MVWPADITGTKTKEWSESMVTMWDGELQSSNVQATHDYDHHAQSFELYGVILYRHEKERTRVARGQNRSRTRCTWVEQIKRWIIVWMLGDARCSMKALERMGKIIRVSYSTKGNNCSFNMWCVDKTGLCGKYTREEQCLICPHSLILLWNEGLAFSREEVEVGDSDNWVVVGVLSDSDNSFTVGKLFDSHKWVIVGVIYYSDNWVTVGFVVR